MKADPRELIRAHYATLVDNRTGKIRLLDHAILEGGPAAVAVAVFVVDIDLPAPVAAGLLTVMGLMSAFFFGVMLQVAERAWNWADEGPPQGPDTSRHAIFLGQIAANAGYASFVCILTASVFVAVGVTHGTALTILSAIGLGLAAHAVLMLLMVAVRVYKLIQERLTEARTGVRASARARRGPGAPLERTRH